MKVWLSVVAAFIVIAAVVGGLTVLITNNVKEVEVIIGIVVILGVSVLIFLMFILAIGFDALKMTDPKQPLGLPAGSVRAMIALMLIVIWVILSVFLFTGTVTLDATKNAESLRLAQQLYTTMSTLVVAVSAFYFGSRSVETARKALAPSASPPVIDSIDPTKEPPGQLIPNFVIKGKNLQSSVAVKLVKDSGAAAATEVLSNDTKIQCTIQVPGTAKSGETWDVVVVNGDGVSTLLKGMFTVG